SSPWSSAGFSGPRPRRQRPGAFRHGAPPSAAACRPSLPQPNRLTGRHRPVLVGSPRRSPCRSNSISPTSRPACWSPSSPARAARPRGGFFLQGFLVMISNPKVLLFFGAFIPQFVDPAGDTRFQVVLLGATAMIVATLSDGTYALLTGRAGAWLARGRVRLMS